MFAHHLLACLLDETNEFTGNDKISKMATII